MCVTYYHWNIIICAVLIWFIPKYFFYSTSANSEHKPLHIYCTVWMASLSRAVFAYTALCAATLFFFLLSIGLRFFLPETVPRIRRRPPGKAGRSVHESRVRGITQHTSPTTVPVAMADVRESDFVQPIDTQNFSCSVRWSVDCSCLSISVISEIGYLAPETQNK